MKLGPYNIGIIKRLLVGRNNRPLKTMLQKLEHADLASLYGMINDREATLLTDSLISVNLLAETLLQMPDNQLEALLYKMRYNQLLHLFNESSIDQTAYFLNLFDKEKQYEFLIQLDASRKIKIEQLLNYPADSAGRLMHKDIFALMSSQTAEEGLNELRNRAQKESIYYIYCVDKISDDGSIGKLEGIISLRQLAIAPSDTILKDIIKKDVISVLPTDSTEDVARKVAHYNFVAIPVVNEKKSLIGIITVDDVVDIIQEQATAKIYAQAGLQGDDRVYKGAAFSIKNRIPWMLLNLVLAALASSVISLFENTMQELIILASLKSIVAGLSGNTAIQTLTVVTRGLATDDFKFISHVKAVFKEMTVGLSIGFVSGISGAILTYVWKGNLMVSIIIFISMVVNGLIASAAGSIIPIMLNKRNWDPAVGSGVLVTMITDIFSFFSFLGLAALGLKYFA